MCRPGEHKWNGVCIIVFVCFACSLCVGNTGEKRTSVCGVFARHSLAFACNAVYWFGSD